LNIAMQLPASAIVSKGSLSAQIEPERSADLYAVWKAVFDGAHAVKRLSSDAHRPLAEEPGSQSVNAGKAKPQQVAHQYTSVALLAIGIESGLVAGSFGVSAEHDPVLELAAPGEPVTVASRISADPVGNQGNAVGANAARRLPVTKEPPDGTMPKPERSGLGEVPELGSSPAQRFAGASVDSVQVFVDGDTVSIVLRDPLISEPEAVHCGFETARRLLGRSNALNQITLNGRTVYQQLDGSLTIASEHAGAVLVFAC
jgi:hypothetical protein